MTNFRKLTAATAALTLGTLMSTAAIADSHNMKCSDYNAMGADDQMKAAQGWKSGREGLREEAMGGNVESGTANVADDVDTPGGREEAREMAMGSDDEIVAMMAEYCKGGDDLMTDEMRHPTDGTSAE